VASRKAQHHHLRENEDRADDERRYLSTDRGRGWNQRHVAALDFMNNPLACRKSIRSAGIHVSRAWDLLMFSLPK
jgi:hypothetical protein